MTEKRQAIMAVLGEEVNLFDWRLTESKLKWLKQVIPDSEYYWLKINSYDTAKYWPEVLKSALEGKKREDKYGDTLYLASDDNNEVHWFAMKKEYEWLVEALEPVLEFEGYFESYNSIDQIGDAEHMVNRLKVDK